MVYFAHTRLTPTNARRITFDCTRRMLCADNAGTFGIRKAFDFEMQRLARKGLAGERQFRLAALNVFGRVVG